MHTGDHLLLCTVPGQVQDDIVQQLSFQSSARRLVASFDRPNISYSVRYADLLPHQVAVFRRHPQPPKLK